jgi:hypothetical protein
MNNGSVATSYATGAVTGNSPYTGGLVGRNLGAVATSYWNTTTSGQATSAGGAGLTSVQMKTASNFTGFSFTTTPGAAGNAWVLIDVDGTANNAGGALGGALPMLASEYATSITNAHQLQLVTLAPGASYTLAGDINAAKTAGGDVWIGGAGFVPIKGFSGVFDGQGRIIRTLFINRPSTWNTGLFESTNSSVIRNVGLVGGSITGFNVVGALVGANYGTVSNSYADVAVTGQIGSGGLVGRHGSGVLSDSYALGAVTGTVSVGGLVGQNFSTINTSYAAGTVSGTSNVGGLVGQNTGVVNHSFWNTTTSGRATSQGGTGLTTAEMKTTANFSSATTANGSVNPAWDLAGSWVSYDGQGAPMLRAFMTPLIVTANGASRTADGTAYSGGAGVTYSATPAGNLFGAVTYGGSAQGAVQAGSYLITPGGLYSTSQQGYAVTYVSGALIVNPGASPAPTPVAPVLEPPVTAPITPPAVTPVAPATPVAPVAPPAIQPDPPPAPSLPPTTVSNATAPIIASITNPPVSGGPSSAGPSPTMALAAGPSPGAGPDTVAGQAATGSPTINTVVTDIGTKGTLSVQNEGVHLPGDLASLDQNGDVQ